MMTMMMMFTVTMIIMMMMTMIMMHEIIYLCSVCTDLGSVSCDDAESRTSHVDGDVVGGEVGAKPEVEPDVAASGAAVAVDRHETLSVWRRVAAAGPASWRQMERHLHLQSSVVGETRLHPANITERHLTQIITTGRIVYAKCSIKELQSCQ